VSHNMNAIQNLCKSSIFLKEGILVKAGKTIDIIRDYLKVSAGNVYSCSEDKLINNVYIKQGHLINEFASTEGYLIVSLLIISKIETTISIDFIIKTSISIPVCFASIGTLNYDEMIKLNIGENNIKIKIFINSLALGEYNVSIDITMPNERYFDRNIDCLSFEIVKSKNLSRQLQPDWGYGYTTIPATIL